MLTVAIIPARAGSERLPNKNTKMLLGKALIEYSIDYALENSSIIDAVFVSTNDAQVKQICERKKVAIIHRPEALATPESPTIATIKHSLEQMPLTVKNVVLLQPTNPLRPKNLLKEAFKSFKNQKADSLMSVSVNHQKFGRLKDGRFTPYNYELGMRSQDMEPLYYENGLMYISSREVIESGHFLGPDHCVFEVNDPWANVDIDTQADWELAEFYLSKAQDK